VLRLANPSATMASLTSSARKGKDAAHFQEQIHGRGLRRPPVKLQTLRKLQNDRILREAYPGHVRGGSSKNTELFSVLSTSPHAEGGQGPTNTFARGVSIPSFMRPWSWRLPRIRGSSKVEPSTDNVH